MFKTVTFRLKVIARAAGLVIAIIAFMGGVAASELWTGAQVISPEALKKLLAEPKGEKPMVLQVGFRTLFDQAHIPGSRYVGPASKPEGLAELKEHVQRLPRNKEVIIYCGCCPWHDCPNIRPAYRALKQMGFTRIKVLTLPTGFGVDWAGKGYPVEKSP